MNAYLWNAGVPWKDYRAHVCAVTDFKRGIAAEVLAVLLDGLRMRGPNGVEENITRTQRATFNVGRAQRLPVAAGDRLLIMGRDDAVGFANGFFGMSPESIR